MNNIHTFVVLAYKESKYLEDCIKSVLNQSVETNVVIATTTDNKFIENLAKKYKLQVIVGKHTSIGGDFDFAKNCVNSKLVTIAHQDDIYENIYAENVINEYKKHPKASIIFTDYYEIRGNEKVYKNTNLKIKRILLTSLKIKGLSGFKFMKRNSLRFGNSICCPAVTFVNDNCPKEVFTSDYKCDVDWFAWEKLSRLKGKFIFIKKCLMGHRISKESTTTNIIKNGIRTEEDYDILCMFWPKWIAKKINFLYKKSEKSNSLGR